MPVGRADNWLFSKNSTLHRGETKSWATSCQVYSEQQTNEKQIYVYTYTQVCMFVCMIVLRARANQRRACSQKWGKKTDTFIHESTINTTVFSPKEKQRDRHACMHMQVCMHVPTAAQPHLQGLRVCSTCVSVCCYYFANPSTVSVCLSVCTCTSVCPDAHQSILKCYPCATSI
jgi:hypothetical protein